ncbi:MAG: hypothetical protein R2845_06355 [Thermomicrobiales bacterium]
MAPVGRRPARTNRNSYLTAVLLRYAALAPDLLAAITKTICSTGATVKSFEP